jgi:hypothetical protein
MALRKDYKAHGMKLEPIIQTSQSGSTPVAAAREPASAGEAFAPVLESVRQSQQASSQLTASPSMAASGPSTFSAPEMALPKPGFVTGPRDAAAAYRRQATLQAPAEKPAQLDAPEAMSSWQKYKDDQLLRNPGGDHYDLEHKKVEADPSQRKSLWGRIGKNLSDAFGNVKNMFSNFLLGAKFNYRDQNNGIREATRKGLVGSIVDFFKDLGSAFSFGHWRPDGSPAPEGFTGHLGHFVSHLKKAFSTDLFDGVGGSVNHMAGNLVLAGWNLAQVVPDATLGNLDAGKKLTTTIFDNGQVLVEYLTDILPAGDAWLRVHAPSFKEGKFPIVYNLGMPERFSGDVRWEYIRNTPFRKSIETVGSLLADVASALTIGEVKLFSDDAPKRVMP